MKMIINQITNKFSNQPAGFYTILYAEMCGLYGQFSILALLILYMTSVFKCTDIDAFICYGAFTSLIYVIPLISGYLADRMFGFKNILLFGFALMIIGTIFLAFPKIRLLYIGLAIFSTGCGFFMPAITAIFGQLYDKSSSNRDNAFTIYYIVKNLGGLLAVVIGGIIANKYGYYCVYLISAAVMLSGYISIIFHSNKLDLNLSIRSSNGIKSMSMLLMIITPLIFLSVTIISSHWTDIFMEIAVAVSIFITSVLYYKFNNGDRKKLTIILFSILMMIIFCIFLGQGGTTLNLFIDRIVNRRIGSYLIPTSFFYALDPLFMLVFGSMVIGSLNKIKGASSTIISFKKIITGFFILGAGFSIIVIAASVSINFGVQPSANYIVSAYTLFPIAELCVMPVVISLITRLAPTGYEGFVMSIYMLGISMANYLTGVFSKIGNINFSIDSIPTMILAAKIYQKTFIISASMLFVAALFSFLFMGLYQRKNITINIKHVGA